MSKLDAARDALLDAIKEVAESAGTANSHTTAAAFAAAARDLGEALASVTFVGAPIGDAE